MIGLSRRNGYIIATALYCIFFVCTLRVVSNWSWHSKLTELGQQGINKKTFYTTYLRGILEKSENLPQLLSGDDKIIEALQHSADATLILRVNTFLQSIAAISDTSDIYLMDAEGNTIAASNWQTDHSFIGKNFSFRPYFQEAMRGEHGRYYAMGTTSSKRGYYFSYPILENEFIRGVVVVKIDVQLVEQNWDHLDDTILVTDPNGVIFLTTKDAWLYKTITPIPAEVQNRIVQSRRYPSLKFIPISSQVRNEESYQFIDVDQQGDSPMTFLKQTVAMSEAGWDIHILTSIQDARSFLRLSQTLTSLSLIFVYILIGMLVQRNYRLRQLDLMKEGARKGLEQLNEELESRVETRTKQLVKSNELLRNEITERKEIERTLKNTRNELTHAAKMAALGQMSAQINHELNQPLAAIRSYTDNGKQFLQKERLEEAMWNLEQIGELTERMAEIGKQLKLFARKSSGLITVVPLYGVIDGALDILKPTLKKSAVEIIVQLKPKFINVYANSVLLQQVLVNLFSNGIHAMELSEEKIITVLAIAEGKTVRITIQDTGFGISQLDAEHIFEPFFTTKKSGQGLGLGLTISERIIAELDSQLVLLPSRTGACFEFILKSS